ncbi:hypothetical protein KR054_011784, partial [Drosophila jambulina]
MNPPTVDKETAEQVRLHLSKEELERQMHSIHGQGDSQEVRGRTSGNSNNSRASGSGSSVQTDGPRQESWIFESVGGYYMPTEDVAKISLAPQEQLLMRNLIYAFSGVPSSYITPDIPAEKIAEMTAVEIAKVRFRVDEAFNGAFRSLANTMLPLIGYYISVQSFIEETNMTPNCGRTRLSLATALSDQMEDYYKLQSKLETDLNEQKLNLKELVRQVRPWLSSLKVFAGMACSSRDSLNSAQLLTLLDEFSKEQKITAPDLKERVAQILAKVTHTYMKIVQLWMQKGILYDAQHEFFVEDTERSNAMSSTLLAPEQCCQAYWSERYNLIPDRLPSFLLDQAQKIFLAGKYLNILRQCNVTMKLLQKPLSYTPRETGHLEIIQESYQLPAGKLLEVIKEQRLATHLRNLRGYFLLQMDGFAETLLDKCQEQLQCNVDTLIPEKLQNLLTESLQKFNDPFKGMLRCQLKACDVATQLARGQTAEKATEDEGEGPETLRLYGYESLALRYEAKWPLSFVLHSQVLEQLQVIQRVLLFLRYVHRTLTLLWQSPADGAALKKTDRSGELRQRMMLCMLNLEQHITLDIAEPRWQSLLQTVDKAQNIDEVLIKFEDTVEDCLRLGLLSSANTFVASIFTLGHICLNFCGFVESPPIDGSGEQFDQVLGEYEEEFGSFITTMLDLVKQLGSPSGKEGERQSCKQLLQRLEE